MKKQSGVAYKQSKNKAFLLIKKKKMYEAQYNSLTNQQFNIDQIQFTTEAIQSTMDVVNFYLIYIG